MLIVSTARIHSSLAIVEGVAQAPPPTANRILINATIPLVLGTKLSSAVTGVAAP